MQRTIRFFVTCFLGLSLLIVSGCGESEKATTPNTAGQATGTASTQSTASQTTEVLPELSAEDQKRADELIAKHGKNALAVFMGDAWGYAGRDENRLLDNVKYFVSKGSDVNAKHVGYMDDVTFTPLAAAAYCGRPEITKYLVSKGADVDVKGQWNQTPLHLAVDSNRANFEVVLFLVEKGANVNAKTESGETPFDGASKRGNPQIIMLLESKGAKSGK